VHLASKGIHGAEMAVGVGVHIDTVGIDAKLPRLRIVCIGRQHGGMNDGKR
jgi:hypothetical protein